MKSQQANVHFNENGTPVADHFDDVYFSNDSGIDETRHVFINGNNLHERWLAHDCAHFVIAETGFGTGLNFLVVMQEFAHFRAAHPQHSLKKLFFISTEKFPLAKKDMRKALNVFDSLENEAAALSNNYPTALEGCHRRHFDEFSTTLDLWIGDVHELMPQWHSPKDGLVDAWFLDGFAPSKNPDMWTDSLFTQMARLSKKDTTFATFTAAGIVKRGLNAAGFTIVKRKGFGRKRDMLTGFFNPDVSSTKRLERAFQGPYYRYNKEPLKPNSRIIIIGSGLAATSAAFALAKRGMQITLCHDKDTLATGASGNAQGGFYPQLHSQASIASRLQAHSFLYAAHIYKRLFSSIKQQSSHVAFDFCGVVQLNFNSKVAERQKKLVNNHVWPENLIKHVDAETLSHIANIPLPYDGLYIEQGGWISPPDLVRCLVEQAKQYTHIDVKDNYTYQSHNVRTITSEKQGNEEHQCIEVTFSNGEVLSADHLILATGAGAVNDSAFQSLPLRPVRGQVEAIPTQAPISQLATVLCHKGYMTPALNNRHALGSTYVKNDMCTEVRTQETEQNLNTHKQAMANTSIVEQLTHDGQARAAIRVGSPDHQPVSGMLTNFEALKPDYVDLSLGKPLHTAKALPPIPISTVCCLGSRGLTTAPLMAELLASELTHEPLPLNNDLCNAVHPARFMIRDCIRGILHPET